jgi:hypothetical protein
MIGQDEREVVRRLHGVAGLARGLAVDKDLAGEDQGARAFAALRDPALDQRHVEPRSKGDTHQWASRAGKW